MKNTTNKDLLLQTAKKRVQFKKHLLIYILVNLLLWVVYFFLFRGRPVEENRFLQMALFVLCVWTIIIVGHYFYAMKWNKKMVEKEVQSLIKEAMEQKEEEMVSEVVEN